MDHIVPGQMMMAVSKTELPGFIQTVEAKASMSVTTWMLPPSP